MIPSRQEGHQDVPRTAAGRDLLARTRLAASILVIDHERPLADWMPDTKEILAIEAEAQSLIDTDDAYRRGYGDGYRAAEAEAAAGQREAALDCLVCEGWGAYCDKHRPKRSGAAIGATRGQATPTWNGGGRCADCGGPVRLVHRFPGGVEPPGYTSHAAALATPPVGADEP